MKKINTFFFSFFTALIITVILFCVIVNFCGRGVTDQPWVRELYPLKKHMAKNKQSPKIIIIGGSASLFGFNGEKLHEYTGMDNVNFSMSILMPMRFYLADLEDSVREGDIVVLPLEVTNHYCDTEEANFSNLAVSLLFGGNPATQKTLSPGELCSLYFQYGFSWINTSLFHEDAPLRRLFKSKRKQGVFDGVYKESYVASRWEQSQDKKGQCGWFSDLSVYGDMMVDQEAKDTGIAAFPLPKDVSEEFVSCYKQIKKLTDDRKATLLLVWPNFYFYAEQTGFSDFRNMLQSHGVEIHGRPESAAFPKCFYHDPIHHMNRSGAELWTYELAKLISRETGRPLKKRNQAWNYLVFADDPAYYFPGVKTAHLYDTGVRVGQKDFPLVFSVPENLKGKKLELNLVALPERKTMPVFTGIQAGGKPCRFKETLHQERMEVIISIPADRTNQDKIALDCAVSGDSIGMERLFIREAPQATLVSFKSGFSIPENWGRWTDGERAELVLSIPENCRNKDLPLTFDVYTFVCAQKPVCKFKILSDGRILKEMSSDKFENSFTLTLPAELTGTKELPLTLEIEDPKSPKELGLSGDVRRLGIGILEISLPDGTEN